MDSFKNSDKNYSNKLKRISLVLFSVLAIVYLYIGLFDSVFYNLELILLPIVLVAVGSISGILVWVIKKFRVHFLTIFFCLGSLSLLSLIIDHGLKTYKETLTIRIPVGFEGKVHLFHSYYLSSEVIVSEHGIGYLPDRGDLIHKVVQGSEDITDALNESGGSELIWYQDDSTTTRSIGYSCFEVIKNKKYPTSSFNQKHTSCMNTREFDSLVVLGIIDSNITLSQYWENSTSE